MNFIEILLHTGFGYTVISSFYKKYVKEIGLKGDEKVLEFGCGAGTLSHHFVKELNSGKLICVDISETAMNILKWILRGYSNVEYKLGDIRELNINNLSYDVVVIHFVLHDVEEGDKDSIVKKLAQTLKDGGRLFIREPMKEGHGMSPEEIRDVMKKAGLEEVSFKYEKKFFSGDMYSGVYENSKKRNTFNLNDS